jgi:uncharacterized RDD family membrane protein YckC
MFCSKCGASVPAGATFCSNCGQPVAGYSVGQANPGETAEPAVATPVSTSSPADTYAATPSPPVQTWQPPVAIQPTSTVGYAGFWLRFVAAIIDGLILLAVRKILFLPFGIRTGMGMGMGGIFRGGRQPQDFSALMPMLGLMFRIAIISALIQWLYFSLMESSVWQATLGKKALGLTVTDLEGRRISFGRATGRYFAKILSTLTIGIGYLMAGFTAKKQALHDMIAGTLVLRKL